MKFASLRSRLTTLFVSIVFLTAALVGTFGVVALRIDLIEKFEQGILKEVSEEVAELATELIFAEHSETFELSESSELLEELQHEGNEYGFRITDAAGRALFASQFFNEVKFARPDSAAADIFSQAITDTGSSVRFFTLPIKNPETGEIYGMLQLGRPVNQINDAITDEIWISGIGVLIATLIAILLGSLTARRILAPIKRITDIAEDISVKNLKRRIRHHGPASDELTILANTLDRMLDRLAENIANLKQFTSDASHELRTPLTAMAATIDVALVSDNPADQKRALSESQSEIRRMTMLVNDLLALARADRGAWPIEKKPISLTPILKGIATELSSLASEKRVAISTENLPDKIEIVGDAGKIKQLFLNLCTNAIKFNRPGGSVIINTKTEKEDIVINVADTGIGIEKPKLKKIFQRFYQTDHSHTHFGSGLGLAISEKIASAHDGKITVASQPGKGSIFTVALPRK